MGMRMGSSDDCCVSEATAMEDVYPSPGSSFPGTSQPFLVNLSLSLDTDSQAHPFFAESCLTNAHLPIAP